MRGKQKSSSVQIRIHACMEMNGLLQNDTENIYALKIALKNMQLQMK